MSYGGGMTRSLLYVADKERVLFGMASIPLQITRDCDAISVGPSGRGVWVEDYSIRQCSPKAAITGGGLFTTVECDDYSRPLASLPRPKTSQFDLALAMDAVTQKVHLDFDDGMGRVAVATPKEVFVFDLI